MSPNSVDMIKELNSKLEGLGLCLEKSLSKELLSGVHSLRLVDKNLKNIAVQVQGGSEQEAELKALYQLVVLLGSHGFMKDLYLGEDIAQEEAVFFPDEKWFVFEAEDDEMPEGILNEELWEYYDMDEELEPLEIMDTQSGAIERGICTLSYLQYGSETLAYFPLNLIQTIHADSGLGSGMTALESRTKALSDILQRYLQKKIVSEAIALPLIPEDEIKSFKKVDEARQFLIEKGFQLRLCDASLGGIYPLVCVYLLNTKNAKIKSSFAMHFDMQVALEEAIQKLFKGVESLADLDGDKPASFNLAEVRDPNNLQAHLLEQEALIGYASLKEPSAYDFVAWGKDWDKENYFSGMCELVNEMEAEIYIRDTKLFDVYISHIIVPGVSDLYPLDDLQWKNKNEGISFREAILNLKHLEEFDYRELLEKLADTNIENEDLVSEFLGVLADEGSAFETLSVVELKAMVYLALSDSESAWRCIRTLLSFESLSATHRLHYQCLDAILDIKLDKDKPFKAYVNALIFIYGEDLLETCVNIINNEECFYGLGMSSLKLEGFKTHTKMLKVYSNLQEALKTSN